MEFIREQAQDAMRQCAIESFDEPKIRYFQGAFKALERAGSLDKDGFLDRYLSWVRKEIDK